MKLTCPRLCFHPSWLRPGFATAITLLLGFVATGASAHAQRLTQDQKNAIKEEQGISPNELRRPRNVVAPSALATAEAEADDKGTTVDKAMDKASDSLNDKLTGWGFGPGFAVLSLRGARPVKSAAVDGTQVKIESESKMRAAPVLEYHWLFSELPLAKPDEKTKMLPNQKSAPAAVASLYSGGTRLADSISQTRRGTHKTWGISIMTEIGDNVIRSVGLGPVFAFQSYEVTGAGGFTPLKALNIGLVAFVEPKVKTVVGNFVDGQTVVAGTQINTQDEHRTGWGLVISTRF